MQAIDRVRGIDDRTHGPQDVGFDRARLTNLVPNAEPRAGLGQDVTRDQLRNARICAARDLGVSRGERVEEILDVREESRGIVCHTTVEYMPLRIGRQ